MTTNVYGLPLRSAVRSRRRRLLRTTMGLALLALLCLIYPGARSLTAQLLGIGIEPPATSDVAADDPSSVAAKRSPAHRADNPLAADARAAAGLILPKLPDEPELVAYVGGLEQSALGLDDAVSDDFRDVNPASTGVSDNGGGGLLGGRSWMGAGVGAAGGGFGGAAGGRTAAGHEATIAANETAASGERPATLGRRAGTDLASNVTAESALEAVSGGGTKTGTTFGAASGPGGGGSTNGKTAASGAGSAASAGVGASPAFADSVPADIAPGVMVIADITGDGGAGSGSSRAGAQDSVAGGLAAGVSGVLADVPEPALLLIFGLGLVSVAYRMRSRLT